LSSLFAGQAVKTIVILLLSCSCLLAQKFASIGDYGDAGSDELAVANLVKSWNPDFIITLGDNNYPDGEASTIDANVGQYYYQYIYPYVGSYGQGSDVNRFFPSLGNHDWHTNPPQPHYDYFVLPNNERYYDFIWGDVHFFALDSDTVEPDGVTGNSIQGQWLQNALSTSISTWRVVYFHHAPYSSSSNHGSQEYMQWPFKEWGADVVMAGHDHTYERVIHENFPYFVNGLGGKSKYEFGPPIPGSIVRYNEKYGAMLMIANESRLTFSFFSADSELIDFYEIINPLPATPSDLVAAINSNPWSVELNWTDNSINENGFIIERDNPGASIFEVVDTVSQNVTTYPDTAVTVATYTYRVKAFNEFGETPYSNTAQVVVPVELTSFTATLVKNEVLLMWTTATEINNMGFEVQKKISKYWSVLEFVEGHGSSTRIHTYQFVDDKPQVGKENAYRLKQIDYDGSFKYSNIVVVSVPVEGYSLEQNYPNPFNPTTKIRFELPVDGIVTIKIFDAFGQEINTILNELKKADVYEIGFNGSNLASGVYIYRLQVNGYLESKMMVLLK
jgi:tartrate-resistant acid phosphatase type 5